MNSFPGLIFATILLILLIVIIEGVIFNSTHKVPLKAEEVLALAERRRDRDTKNYFVFGKQEYTISRDFKSRMNPDGEFIRIVEPLSEFPAVAAGILKYKKHEWILIAFEKQQNVDLIWINKGDDRTCVNMGLSYVAILNTAKQRECNSVLLFHNHPNPDPQYSSYNEPSQRDIDTAEELAAVLTSSGINLLEFICEKGTSYKYYSALSESFLPLSDYIHDINQTNGLNVEANLSLQRELHRRWLM